MNTLSERKVSPTTLVGSTRPRAEPWILALALTLPSVGTALYFYVFATASWAPTLYSASKILQFALPLIAFASAWQLPVFRLRTSRIRASLLGLLFGGILAAFAIPLWLLFFDDSALAYQAAQGIRPKLSVFGVRNPEGFALLAIFLSFIHSFLEEYYYRWFLYRALRVRLSQPISILISSLGFMAHHVLVVHAYLGPDYLLATVVLSFAVAVGGAFWAWIYERTGTLLAPWLGHVLADLLIMGIGYDLIWGG